MPIYIHDLAQILTQILLPFLATLISIIAGALKILDWRQKQLHAENKKKLDEILSLVESGFVTKREYLTYKEANNKRVDRLEIGVFMRKHDLEEGLE